MLEGECALGQPSQFGKLREIGAKNQGIVEGNTEHVEQISPDAAPMVHEIATVQMMMVKQQTEFKTALAEQAIELKNLLAALQNEQNEIFRQLETWD